MAAWLREEVVGQVHGLERLVVKVSVHKKLSGRLSRSYDPSEIHGAAQQFEQGLYTSVETAATKPRLMPGPCSATSSRSDVDPRVLLTPED